MAQPISRADLHRRLLGKNRPTVIEALPEKYFAHAHIPGAINLPHDEIIDRATAVLPDKNATLVVYCASDTCMNSHLAAETLSTLGYKDVQIYFGGKKDWIDAGLPVDMTS